MKEITRIQVTKFTLKNIKQGIKTIVIPINRKTSTSCGYFFNKKFWSGHDFSELWKDSVYGGLYEYLHVSYLNPNDPQEEGYKVHHRVRCAAEPGQCIFYRKKDNFGVLVNVISVHVDVNSLNWIIKVGD